MTTKLYVGNLAYTVSDDDLRNLFSQAGVVKTATVIMDREANRSKGFGFVEMATPADAQKAITMFNGQRQWERPLTVNIARPREERPPRTGGGGYGGGGGGYGGGGYGGGGKGDRGNRGNRGDRGDRRGRF